MHFSLFVSLNLSSLYLSSLSLYPSHILKIFLWLSVCCLCVIFSLSLSIYIYIYCWILDPMEGIQNPEMSCAVSCLTSPVFPTLANESLRTQEEPRASHEAPNGLRTAKSFSELCALYLPNRLRQGKGKIWSSKVKGVGKLPPQEGKGRGEPLQDLLIWWGVQSLKDSYPFPFLAGHYGGAWPWAKDTRGWINLIRGPMGIIHQGWFPIGNLVLEQLSKYKSGVHVRDSGQRGEWWGLPAGINHPYSNTPPQTTWFPNNQTRRQDAKLALMSKEKREKT